MTTTKTVATTGATRAGDHCDCPLSRERARYHRHPIVSISAFVAVGTKELRTNENTTTNEYQTIIKNNGYRISMEVGGGTGRAFSLGPRLTRDDRLARVDHCSEKVQTAYSVAGDTVFSAPRIPFCREAVSIGTTSRRKNGHEPNRRTFSARTTTVPGSFVPVPSPNDRGRPRLPWPHWARGNRLPPDRALRPHRARPRSTPLERLRQLLPSLERRPTARALAITLIITCSLYHRSHGAKRLLTVRRGFFCRRSTAKRTVNAAPIARMRFIGVTR